MYAIIESGNKQFKVKTGDVIKVEKLGVNAGESYTFENVLLTGDADEIIIGSPYIKGASVTATVLGDGKEKKVIVYRYKRKSGYHKKNGHRQPFTQLKIESIN